MDKSKLPLYKREELKRKEDELLAKEVYEEFVATFSNDTPGKIGKTFVRGEVVNAADYASKNRPSSTARLYKPSPTLFLPSSQSPVEAARRKAQEKAEKIMEEAKKNRPHKLGKKKEEKKTSNLEAFKEELKRTQEARAERRVLRQQLKDHLGTEKEVLLDRIAPSLDNPYMGSYENDPNTTNLFISNLSPKLTEDELCKMFGHFGPLASVKIMWPRSEEERSRGYNTGFIAFMTRKDAERAVARLKGKMVMGYEMKVGWGKSVPIPPNPVYIPPKMLEMALPPPPSGLPFNAQPRKDDREAYRWPLPPQGAPPPYDPEQREAWDKMIRNATIKVVIPTERQLLCAVHRVVEFAVREGPIFEAVLMNKELNNNLYRFLFDNHSPAHVYYRWKLFSILQGDSPNKWSIESFRVFEGGSTWIPPPMNFYQQGLPKELYEDDEEEDEDEWVEKGRENDRDDHSDRNGSRHHHRSHRYHERSPSPIRHGRDETFITPQPPQMAQVAQQASSKKGQLSERQRSKLKLILDELSPERDKIADAMVYCVEHAEAAEEILDLICEGLFDPNTTVPKKVAKLYLISDILNNCTAKVANVSYYRKHVAGRLEEIFRHINGIYEKIEARLKAEQFKQRIMTCFRSWEDTAVYTNDFLINLQNVFLGLASNEPCSTSGAEDVESDQEIPTKIFKKENSTTRSSLFKPLQIIQPSHSLKKLVDYDLDGVPLDDEDDHDSTKDQDDGKDMIESTSQTNSSTERSMFVRSKWEEVDPEQDTKSSRWEKAETSHADDKIFFDDEDIDGVPLDDNLDDEHKKASSPTRHLDRTPGNSIVDKMDSLSSVSDEQRQKLREIEVKVMKFQDELESGVKKRTSGLTIQEEVEKYREKLLQRTSKGDDRKKDNTSGDSKYHKGKKSSSKKEDDKSRREKTGSSTTNEKDKERGNTAKGTDRQKNSKEKERDEKSREKDKKKYEEDKKSQSRSGSKDKDRIRDKDRREEDRKISGGRKRSRSVSPKKPKSKSRSPSDSSKHKKKKH